jgi:uncharacterized membrane protein
MTGKYYLVGILLTAAVLVVTVVAYPHLPNSVATHWNTDNQPNGYSPRWALFVLGPGLMTGMMLLFSFLPWLSPKNFEVESFRSTYLQIMLMLVTMLAYFSVVALWAGSQGFLLVTQTYLIRQATTALGASRVASAAPAASFQTRKPEKWKSGPKTTCTITRLIGTLQKISPQSRITMRARDLTNTSCPG